MQKPDKTEVRVIFYEISEEKAKENIRKGENVSGKIVEQKTFELAGGLNAEKARKTIYAKLKREMNLKTIEVERIIKEEI